jgi:hypothetical protein
MISLGELALLRSLRVALRIDEVTMMEYLAIEIDIQKRKEVPGSRKPQQDAKYECLIILEP